MDGEDSDDFLLSSDTQEGLGVPSVGLHLSRVQFDPLRQIIGFF